MLRKRIIYLVFTVIAALLLFKYCEFKKGDTATIEYNSNLIQQQIVQVGKLIVTEGHFSQVLTYKDKDKYLMDLISFDKKALIVVNADVTISYDLRQMKYDIDEKSKTITILSIPKEEIKIVKVSVFTKGDAYEKYDAAKIFNEGKSKIQENNKAYIAKQEAEAAKKFEELKAGMTATASGLMYKITKSNPEGKAPKNGDIVSVHYAGKLTNGQEFDNSFKRGEPIEFPIGVGQVIKGWDEGIQLLKEGESATLLIPSELGYGARGAGGVIPPNAWLIFDVELVKVK